MNQCRAFMMLVRRRLRGDAEVDCPPATELACRSEAAATTPS